MTDQETVVERLRANPSSNCFKEVEALIAEKGHTDGSIRVGYGLGGSSAVLFTPIVEDGKIKTWIPA